MKTLVIVLLLIALIACVEKESKPYAVGDVAMVVGFFDDYNGKSVRVVGYLHQRANGARYELIPSKDHRELVPPASILSLMLLPDENIRNGSVASELEECLGKITYVSGLGAIYSGLPVLNKVAEVSC